MNFQFFNFKTNIVIIAVLLIIIAGSLWFYQDYKETQKSLMKVENKLVPQGFDDFYQKQGNKFCVKKQGDEQEQQAVIKDMLWVLDDSDYRNVRIVKCENGVKGIEIK